MTFASVVQSLVKLLETVPGTRTVERADQLDLETPGAVIPGPERCPLIRVERALRPASKESAWELSGSRQRHLLLDCKLWAYLNDVPGGADGFQDWVEEAEESVRVQTNLGGMADTPQSRLLRLKVVETSPGQRALGLARKQGALHAGFKVDAWEEVW